MLYGTRRFQGVIPFLKELEEKRYKQYIRVFLRQYQSAQPCPTCGGAKLRPEALRVRVAGQTIGQASELPVARLREWLAVAAPPRRGDEPEVVPGRPLASTSVAIAETILKELVARLGFLDDVGLGYLTLERQTRTLSGGEAQRITLANALGSRLVDTLYVLDEPTIGLHPADNDRLLQLLVRLRDAGNTVLVVEHDPDAMRLADWLVELGPGSGEHGGDLVFAGTPAELLTGRHAHRALPLGPRGDRAPRSGGARGRA